MAKAVLQTAISGKGVAEPYCYVDKPDFGHGQFKTERGRYKVQLTLKNDDPKCVSMIKQIDKVHNENYSALVEEYENNPPATARGKKPLKPYEGDMPYIDNGDGTTTFRFSSFDRYTSQRTGETVMLPLSVCDSKGKPLPKDSIPAIGAGSELKVKYKLIPYGYSPIAGASVKLQMDAVMIIKLVEYGVGNVDWGDEVEEDGFSVADIKHKEEASFADEDDEDYGEDGDF